MDTLYSDLAEICHLFYKQYFPHRKIADRLDRILKRHNCQKILFIGGLIYVARILQQKGYKITFLDYTPEMLEEAKPILKNVPLHLGDMRSLSLSEKYDAILAIGRSFTYMYNDEDAMKALKSFHRHLKPGGIMIIDNYETGKIDRDNYFGGILRTKAKGVIIKRTSTIRQQSGKPAIYRWDCVYEKETAKGGRYEDRDHLLKAFTKKGLEKLVAKSGLKFISHHPNFEKRSFITVAQR